MQAPCNFHGTKAMPVIRIPYRPRYPEVHREIESKRFFALVAHRRFGKTVLAVNHLIKQAITCKKPSGHFAYVAPLRTQAKAVAWDYLKQYTREIPGRRIHETELSVTLPGANGTNARVRIFGADNPDSLRGLYFDAVVLDEVGQMKAGVWEEVIQPALADRQGSALFIGTPKGINLFSRLYFFAVGEQARGSNIWGAACYPVERTNCLPPADVARLKEELSPAAFRQEMCCDFSASSDETLITMDEVTEALGRKVDPVIVGEWPLVIGVDVARFGEDATVFFPRQGLAAYTPTILRKKSNVEVARLLADRVAAQKPHMVCIDQGQGTGVIDLVKELCPTTIIHEVPFGSQALASDRYINRRAEMWCAMRDWLRAGGSLPDEPGQALVAELTSPGYSFDPAGRLKLEAKESIRKRLRHSTDLADALCLTFAVRLCPGQDQDPHVTRSVRPDYDPFN